MSVAPASAPSPPRDPGRQLRPDRRALGRSSVGATQRKRIIAAAVEAVEDVGYASVTVSNVISRARVSRRTFYEVFADREDCVLAALDQVLANIRPLVEQAYASQSRWREGVRAALALLLELMERSPGLARLLVVESMAGGPPMLRRRAEMAGELARGIDRGRTYVKGQGPPPITAEAVVGGILAVLHTRLVTDDTESFGMLLGPLMSVVVRPYLGASAAAKELRTAGPQESGQRLRALSMPAKNPLDGLNMRLTYRTIQVLRMIAEHPGASNREVADDSGILDQGQISKLLSRLAGLGLIENSGAGQPYGASNKWRLTSLGEQLEHSTR